MTPIYNKDEVEDITLQVTTNMLWKLLVEHGEHELLYKLNVIEKYNIGSVIVPSGVKGFSYRDDIHNMVVRWLKLKGINVWNPENEAIELERALHE
jgi:hypothetical protein